MIDDRALRRQQIAIAMLLFALALGLPLLDAFQLWPLTAVGGVISALLLWGAFRDESIAGPVVGLVLTAMPPMFVESRPAVGSLAAVVVALALGEHIATMQHTRCATPGHTARSAGTGSVALHAGAAAVAVIVTMVATVLPEARLWSLAALVALAVIAVVTQRRRAGLADTPLPPPERLA